MEENLKKILKKDSETRKIDRKGRLCLSFVKASGNKPDLIESGIFRSHLTFPIKIKFYYKSFYFIY